MDSLLSIVQMPGGVPVGTLAIGKAGAVNAAHARRLHSRALHDKALARRGSRALRAKQTDERRGDAARRGVTMLAARRDHRHSRRRPARAACWRSPARGSGSSRMSFRPSRTIPPSTSARRTRRRDFLDEEALAAFAESVDVVTYEFENVPARTAEVLERASPVRPNPRVLALTQDRLIEKKFVRGLGHRDAPTSPTWRTSARSRARVARARAAVDPEDPPLRL